MSWRAREGQKTALWNQLSPPALHGFLGWSSCHWACTTSSFYLPSHLTSLILISKGERVSVSHKQAAHSFFLDIRIHKERPGSVGPLEERVFLHSSILALVLITVIVFIMDITPNTP